MRDPLSGTLLPRVVVSIGLLCLRLVTFNAIEKTQHLPEHVCLFEMIPRIQIYHAHVFACFMQHLPAVCSNFK